ncbi:MAG: winged helix DNA-binding domain-containing protein [Candidatus Dormibacteraeota bacterium]|nr:winged helix DNA-binding domain-containing protein [Candidatus Dormibacteraeota bacterium]
MARVLNLSWAQVVGRRLTRHHLLTPARAEELVAGAGDICGVHAQMEASAELMLGMRVAGITRRDVRSALWSDRTLVKTVGLRGTLHLLPAGEVPTWMAANRLRFEADERRRGRLGIDPQGFSGVVDAISAAVGPEPITKLELERELETRAGGWAVAKNAGWLGSYSNWPMALGWAAALGRVCYGPTLAGRITFVRLADWTGWREEDPFAAGLFVLRRFLRAYGPSTRAEFARWFGLEPALARRLFEELQPELAEVDVEGSRRALLAEDLDAAAEPAPDTVHLLPHFDVYTVGSHPRDQLMPPGSPVALAAPGTAAPLAVLLLGGCVAGVWERRPKGKQLVIRIDAHKPLTPRQKEMAAEQAQRAAQVLELQLALEFGALPLRWHL